MANKRRNNTIIILSVALALALIVAISFMIALIVVLVQNSEQSDSSLPTWPPPSTSALGTFKNAAVAADNGMCSEIGRNIMFKGGNAVDAAVATVLCTGVMNAQSAGIGGGHFMTIYNKTSKSCFIIDARETAPGFATRDMFVNETVDVAARGWPSIAIPGEIYGLRKAYELGGSGRVEWRDLLQPTIDMCRNGYLVSPALAEAIYEKTDALQNETTMKDLFFNKEANRMYQAGDIMRRPILADTLETLANSPDPIKEFYDGSLTQMFMQDFAQYGVNITADDFRNYKALYGPVERPAITGTFAGTDLIACGPPPPSSSAITISILKIMSEYNITADYLRQSMDNNVETYHVFIEAMKYAYASREYLGDMTFVPDALDLARNFTSDAFAEEVKSRISYYALQNQSDYYILNNPPYISSNNHGTSHISILDTEGNAVSVTSTVNLYFGSLKRSTSTDIIWNDDMNDFSTPGSPNFFGYDPTPTNYIQAGKRPLSSMTPIVVYDNTTGDVKMVAGAAGGSRIISATANVVMRALWFGQDVKEAIDSPRLHNQLDPYQTEYETGFPQVYVDQLTKRGQIMVLKEEAGSSSSCIVRQGDQIYANSDYRKPGGYPAGF